MTAEQKKALEAKLTEIYNDCATASFADDLQEAIRLSNYSKGILCALHIIGYSVVAKSGVVSIVERKPKEQDAKRAVSVGRSNIVIVYAGEVQVAFTGQKSKITAILTEFANGTCKVEMHDGNISALSLLGLYQTRKGAMRAIGRFYGKGNYKFVRQYSTKGRQ